MAWIKTIAVEDAEGALKRQYEVARKRAGKVYTIVQLSSLRPDIVERSMDFYVTLMHSPGQLSRAQREMLAVVVSRANQCFY